jgi:hypothetical protein
VIVALDRSSATRAATTCVVRSASRPETTESRTSSKGDGPAGSPPSPQRVSQ